MLALIYYLFKVSIAITSFYMLYYVLFRKEKQFGFNRLYLRFSLIVSFLIPLLSFTISNEVLPKTKIPGLFITKSDMLETTNSVSVILADSKDMTDYLLTIALLIYISISVFLILRLLYGYLTVSRIIKKGSKRTILNQEVVITEKDICPFSLFKKIIIPHNLRSSQDLPAIIAHEKVHISEGHFIDLLISELSFIFLWFNPFAWFFNNAIRTNLEYIADNTVVTDLNDTENYQMAMVRMVDKRHITVLSNALNVSQLKNRIIMMKRKKQSRHPVFKKLVTVPLTIIMVVLLSGKEYNALDSNEGEILIKGKVTSLAEKVPLASVSVIIKGKPIGTITDMEGNFAINVSEDDKALVFVYQGYESKEIEIDNRDIINVALKKSDDDTNKNLSDKKIPDEGEILIKGKVTSSDDKTSLASVNVLIKGKPVGTITDLEGVYAIKVNKDDNVLVFMYQGYESKEIEIKDLKEISVELSQKKYP